ncbi:MAG: ABC1 kinase family protein [Acidimicrobiales bacterium]
MRGLRIGATVARHVGPGLVRRRDRTAAGLAPRIHRAVVALGAPFIKLSQVVASSPGLFPPAISHELRDLLDAAPPEPWPAIRAAIEAGLGAPAESLFESIEADPLAAASIAQVHGATRPDGSQVVVKVRRPGVEHRFLADLRLLRLGARLAERWWSAARVLSPVAIVDDAVATVRRELDFVLEADSMERYAANLGAFGSNERIRVPAVHRDRTGPGVLTMERVEGVKVDDLTGMQLTGLDITGLLKAGVRAWIESAVEHGFFHGDVHAGNLMLDGEGRVAFLDFGIMGELDEATRALVRRGVVALLYRRDFEVVAGCLAQLGAWAGTDVSTAAAATAIRRLAEPLLAKPISEIDYQDVFAEAVRRAVPHGARLPSSLVLLAKQILYFERYARLIAPDYDILADTGLIEFMIDDE